MSEITNIHEASAATLLLPQSLAVMLSGGRSVTITRLSWLQFEAVWQRIASIAAAVLSAEATPAGLTSAAAPDSGESAAERLGQALAAAPACVLSLVVLCSGISEPEAAALPADDVLALGAAALELNFNQGAGLRSFFAAAAQLAH